MNVILTDTAGMNVSAGRKEAFVFRYRMFATVLVIFTNDIFIIPFSLLQWSTERNPTCLFLSMYLFLKT